VAVQHAQRDLDPGVVRELSVEHRAADDESGFGQGVAGRHRIVERLVHRSSGVAGGVSRAAGKRIIGRGPAHRRSSPRPSIVRRIPSEVEIAGWIAGSKGLAKVVEH
jgi:hypothetical protein